MREVGHRRGSDVTSSPVVGTFDNSSSSFDQRQCSWGEDFALLLPRMISLGPGIELLNYLTRLFSLIRCI